MQADDFVCQKFARVVPMVCSEPRALLTAMPSVALEGIRCSYNRHSTYLDQDGSMIGNAYAGSMAKCPGLANRAWRL